MSHSLFAFPPHQWTRGLQEITLDMHADPDPNSDQDTCILYTTDSHTDNDNCFQLVQNARVENNK
jgi:hypothetical protein